MKLSIGSRLFIAVLLAILAVAAISLALMRARLINDFDIYAARVELDRLQALTAALEKQYAQQHDWSFLPDMPDARSQWLAQELARLQGAVSAPATPSMPARTTAHAPPLGNAELTLPVPPVPPVPPLPPLPPLESGATAGSPLQDRVMLVDAAGQYLAGSHIALDNALRRPIDADGRTVAYLALAAPRGPTDAPASDFFAGQHEGLLVIVVLASLLSTIAASLLSSHFRRPIRRLADGARALAGGRLDTRVDLRRSDELGELANVFNQLAGELEQREQARRQWVADTSHELRTPLSVLRAQLEALQDGIRSASPEHTAAMLQQVISLNKLIDDLHQLACHDVGRQDYRMQQVDLWALVTRQLAEFDEKLRAAGLTWQLGAPPAERIVRCDPERMRQLIANLLENSVRYTNRGGQVAVHAVAAGDEWRLVIEDSAPGVPDDVLARLGERWFRVERSRSRAFGGSGLGLALCRAIAHAHRGRIEFAHASLGGLRCTVTIPIKE